MFQSRQLVLSLIHYVYLRKACGSEQAKAMKTEKQRRVERARKVKTTNAI